MNNYIIFCDKCSFKKNIKNSTDLKEFKIIKSAPVQKNLPFIDHSLNKVFTSNEMELPKKVKCPKCGFAIRPKLVKKEEKNDSTNK
jgi:DNA-directed RNA polymerase subunit RPC12/RpoP